MKYILILLFFASITLITSCDYQCQDVSSYKEEFKENEKKFEALVSLLKNNTFKVGYFIERSELPNDVVAMLDDLNVINLSTRYSECSGIIQYEFEVSWCRGGTIHIIKDQCDLDHRTLKNFRDKGQMIDQYGLGNTWLMFIDHDFI